MYGEPVAAPAGQPAVALEMPEECTRYWVNLGTAGEMKINPACRPLTDDGSDRHVVVQCSAKCTAVYADNEARSRQTVRNVSREEPALTVPNEQDKGECSEWLTTAARHKPFHRDQLPDGFVTTVTTCDEYGGWVELADLVNNWPPEGHDNWHRRRLGTVERCLRNRHWAY
eukprot:2212293-Pyramimonas_sp.AAC.1